MHKEEILRMVEVREEMLSGHFPDNDLILSVTQKVSEAFDVSVELIRSKSRKRHIVIPRFIAMWIAHNVLKQPVNFNGQFFGNRDHSSINHACKSVLNWYDTEPTFKKKFNQILFGA